MANSISTRSSVLVQFNIDTDGPGAPPAAPPPLALLCNRDYLIVDLVINNTTGGPISGTITNTTAANPPVISTVSTINALAANTISRPIAVAAAVATVNLDTAYYTVVRGSTVKVNMTASGDFCTGYLTVLPGNRYSAVTLNAAYYANNSASGNSSASVEI